MTTFTEMVAAVVVHSSAAAYSHFGVTLLPVQLEHPTPVERTVVRTAPITPRKIEKTMDCPAPRVRVVKA